MKKVLITGSGGFTGQHLIQFLKTISQVEIVGIDLHHSTKLKTHQMDLLDYHGIDRIIKIENPDYIIHLAGINKSADYQEFYQYNVFTSINILEAIIKHNYYHTRLLFISSSAVYGKTETHKLKETSEKNPINFYGNSKLAMENAVLQYFYRYKINLNIVRPFNIVGIGQDESFVIPYFINRILEIKKSKSKAEIETKNLSSARDFIDVRDVVAAYWQILNLGKPGEVYNVSSGKSIKIKLILEKIIEYTDTQLPIIINEGKIQPGEIPVLVGDSSKLLKLNWNPHITIENSIKDIITAY